MRIQTMQVHPPSKFLMNHVNSFCYVVKGSKTSQYKSATQRSHDMTSGGQTSIQLVTWSYLNLLAAE